MIWKYSVEYVVGERLWVLFILYQHKTSGQVLSFDLPEGVVCTLAG